MPRAGGRGHGIGPNIADLRYADRSDRNTLDVYMPPGVDNPPVVMWLHGGAFQHGDKAEPRGLKYFQSAGIAVAAMNYRLSDEAVWPAQREDLRDAFACLRKNARSIGFDPSRMGSFGISAGGYLSAMAAIDLAADPATRLRASVIWYPPVDFTTMDEDMKETGLRPRHGPTAAADSPESRLIGKPVGDHPDLAQEANPITHLMRLPAGTPLPALLIQHGLQDDTIPAGQSRRLHAAFERHGTSPRLELDLLADGSHGLGSFARPEIAERVIGFLLDAFED